MIFKRSKHKEPFWKTLKRMEQIKLTTKQKVLLLSSDIFFGTALPLIIFKVQPFGFIIWFLGLTMFLAFQKSVRKNQMKPIVI
jgi:hypothetical protein